MADRKGQFAGDNPMEIARRWLREAAGAELNDPNAAALATVDGDGLPNVRMVLVKAVRNDGIVFYTNYTSAKAREIDASGKAALALHWKSLRRQVRARGEVVREAGREADEYYATRSVESRLGAWASRQSTVIQSREALVARFARAKLEQGRDPKRPAFWGGYRLIPLQIEFWSNGAHRLHDRFLWRRPCESACWTVDRLSP